MPNLISVGKTIQAYVPHASHVFPWSLEVIASDMGQLAAYPGLLLMSHENHALFRADSEIGGDFG